MNIYVFMYPDRIEITDQQKAKIRIYDFAQLHKYCDADYILINFIELLRAYQNMNAQITYIDMRGDTNESEML